MAARVLFWKLEIWLYHSPVSNSSKVSHWFWMKTKVYSWLRSSVWSGSCPLFNLLLTPVPSCSLPYFIKLHWSFSSSKVPCLSHLRADVHAISFVWKNVFLLFAWINPIHHLELSWNIPFSGKHSLSLRLGLISHECALITSPRNVSSFGTRIRLLFFMMRRVSPNAALLNNWKIRYYILKCKLLILKCFLFSLPLFLF